MAIAGTPSRLRWIVFLDLVLAGSSFGSPSTIDDVAKGIDASQQMLLRIPGGIRIAYRFRVEQDPARGYFLLEDGARGELMIRWPKLFAKVSGINKENHKPIEREGEYNFEVKAGGGRDRLFVQITPYRQAWSAVTAFPLRYQFYDVADQFYVPGTPHRSDAWLPSCLHNEGYSIDGEEVLEGVRCLRVRRLDGGDTLWIAPERSYIVCRRERRDPKNSGLLEVTENKKLSKVAEGIWLPHEQRQARFDPTYRLTRLRGEPAHVVTLLVGSIEVGAVQESQLHISIPKQALVQDQIAGATYRKTGLGDRGFEGAILQARSLLSRPRTPSGGIRKTTIILAGLFVALCGVAVVLAWQTLSTFLGSNRSSGHFDGSPRNAPPSFG